MLNKAELIGRIGKDPEMRATRDGRKIANFSVATSERWKDKQTGEDKEQTEWHRCVCFNDKLAEAIEKYWRKGDLVYICGAIKTRKWQDQSGNDRYSTEIVLQGFDCKAMKIQKAGGGPQADESQYGSTKTRQRYGDDAGDGDIGGRSGSGGQRQSRFAEDMDDEIPF